MWSHCRTNDRETECVEAIAQRPVLREAQHKRNFLILKHKLQHWRGFPAMYRLGALPVLEFDQ
jgi:hypothetical protein